MLYSCTHMATVGVKGLKATRKTTQYATTMLRRSEHKLSSNMHLLDIRDTNLSEF